MLKAVDIIRDKAGNIVGYMLEDNRGHVNSISVRVVKQMMLDSNKKIEGLGLLKNIDGDHDIIYLKDRGNNVIVTKGLIYTINKYSDKNLRFKLLAPDLSVESVLNKAKLLGINAIDVGETAIILNGNNVDVIGHKFTVMHAKELFNGIRFESIDLTNLDTHDVTSTVQMFKLCTTDKLIIGDIDTSNVTDMSYMFLYSNIKHIDFGSMTTHKVYNMEGMFDCCHYANELNLSNFDTSNVVNMDSMFHFCIAKSINLNGFNTDKVLHTSNMFGKCNSELITDNYKIKMIYDNRIW